jgi:serine/threonine-protein kinase
MGTVVRAYDAVLQREVALKQLRSRPTVRGRARMVREARAMAKLSHPNVVSVFDVDVTQTTVTIAMEYIDGVTLRRWLAKGPRAAADILAVFAQAARGLAAAHAAGLVHHDFKPTNVLTVVDRHAPGGVLVKVTDFGVAKLVDRTTEHGGDSEAESGGEPDEEDEITREGEVVGTPRYMAPEQHLGEPTGPAADQYAFATALWEALTSEPPFGAPTTKALCKAKLGGPPPWPGAEDVPTRVHRALRRALAPRPSDRFESIDELLAELLVPPKPKRTAIIAGVVAIGCAAAVAVWPRGATEPCTGAEARMDAAWNDADRGQLRSAFEDLGAAHAAESLRRVESGLDGYTQRWAKEHYDACAATAIAREQSPELMDRRMACLRRAELDIVALVDVLSTGDPRALRGAPLAVARLPAPERCADVSALDEGFEPTTEAQARRVRELEEQVAVAKASSIAGRYEETLRIVDEALESSEGLEYSPVLVDLRMLRAQTLERQGQFAEAADVLRRVLRDSLGATGSMGTTRASSDLVSVLGNRMGRYDEAGAIARVALALSGDRGLRATALIRVGELYALRGDAEDGQRLLEEGLDLREQIHGPEGILLVSPLVKLATISRRQGRFDEARRRIERAIGIEEGKVGRAHPDLMVLLNNYGNVLAEQGEIDRAREAFERSLEIQRGNFGPDHPGLGLALHNLANVSFLERRYEEAEDMLREALANAEAAFGPDHPEVAITLGSLADVCMILGKLDEAEALQRRSIEILLRQYDPDHREVLLSQASLGTILERQGKTAEAETIFRRTLRSMDSTMGRLHPQVAVVHENLGSLLARQARYAEAESNFRLALRARKTKAGSGYPPLEGVDRKLVWILHKRGRTEVAHEEFGALEPLAP